MSIMFYSSYIMSKYSSMRRSSIPNYHYSSGVDTRGLQATDLVVGYDHPVWEEVARQGEKDAEAERRAGEVEVDFDTMFRLAESGDPKVARELGGAYLRVMGQRVVSYGSEAPNPGLENSSS